MDLVGPEGESIRLEDHEDFLCWMSFVKEVEGFSAAFVEGYEGYISDGSCGVEGGCAGFVDHFCHSLVCDSVFACD